MKFKLGPFKFETWKTCDTRFSCFHFGHSGFTFTFQLTCWTWTIPPDLREK